MADIKVGKVTHYFDKIGVAVVAAEKLIKVGDRLRFSNSMGEFEQTVDSMQVDHQNVPEVKPGQSAGMKVDNAVKDGDEIYKLE